MPHLGKLKCNGSGTIWRVHGHVLGVLDGLGHRVLGLPSGLPISDNDHQDGLLQNTLLDAVEQEGLDDLRVQAGSQGGHAVELNLQHAQHSMRSQLGRAE